MAVYFIRALFFLLFKKFLKIENDRKGKNISLVIAIMVCTLLYFITDGEFNINYTVGGIVLFLLGLIPARNKEIENVSEKIQ
jgi:hypothetical protein